MTLKKNMAYIESICKKYNCEVEFEVKEFEVTLEEAIRRDANRDFSVGEQVIRRAYKRYIQPEKQKANVKHILKTFMKGDKPKAILADLDGSLSINSSNRSYYDSNKNVLNDTVNPYIKDMLNLFAEHKNTTIIIVSGREGNSECLEATETWLNANGVKYIDIFMRQEKDSRPDTIVKKEIYQKYIEPNYDVIFVVDDRLSVVKQWCDLDLFVFNVNQDPLNLNSF